MLVQINNGTAKAINVRELRADIVPLIPLDRRRDEPFGRDTIIVQAAEAIRAKGSVQLYGSPGIGKMAITWAVLRRLAPISPRGWILEPSTGEPHTLCRLYERLTQCFFGVNLDLSRP